MALERIPADIRYDGGVARMSDPDMIREIKAAVTIPVMAKVRPSIYELPYLHIDLACNVIPLIAHMYRGMQSCFAIRHVISPLSVSYLKSDKCHHGCFREQITVQLTCLGTSYCS
jgi:hypothetical protein